MTNELETHYSHDPSAAPASGAKPAGTVETVKAAVVDAATTAQSTIADVGERARDGVSSARRTVERAYDRTSAWASDHYETASRNATYARRRSFAEINRSRRNVERLVDENPIMLGVAGLAAGLLVGALLPGTRRENQAFGRYADEVKDQGYRYARDLAEQGRHFVEENLTPPRPADAPPSPERV